MMLDEARLRHLENRVKKLERQLSAQNGRVLSPVEVALKLGLHVKTVQRMLRDGRIPAVKIGHRWMILESVIMKRL